MRTGMGVWSAFLVLGALLWLTTAGAFTHPAYRLVVMLAVLSWAGYIMWSPTSKSN